MGYTARRYRPQCTGAILGKRPNIAHVERLETPVLVSRNTVRSRNPERAVCALEQFTDIIASQLGGGLRIGNCAASSIEARQTSFCSGPKISIPGLQNRMNCILRNPVLGLPRLAAKLL